jgi:hypothetical protein
VQANPNGRADIARHQVFPGQNAPVNPEGAGIVPQDSLAAESYRQGGDFASNAGSKPEQFSLEERAERLQSASGGASQGGGAHTATAPSYIESQYIKDTSGPHGKNIHEDKNLGEPGRSDGLRRALNSEPGTADDPSRLAERKFQNEDFAAAGGQGPREGAVNTESKYDNLDRQEEA